MTNTIQHWKFIEEQKVVIAELRAENERLRKVIIRAKDALLDGQSPQWVHDVLVAVILGHKPTGDAPGTMTDIVEKLRYIHCQVDSTGNWIDANVARPIMLEAADVIERLRNDIAERINVNRERWQEIERLQAVNKILSQRICDLTKKP